MRISSVTVSQLSFDFSDKTITENILLPSTGKLRKSSDFKLGDKYLLNVIWPNNKTYEYTFDSEYFFTRAKNSLRSIKQFKSAVEGIPYRLVA